MPDTDETTETDEQTDSSTAPEETDESDTSESSPPTDEQAEPETFPREVVEKLRKENASYREKAKAADVLAERLHTALVAATGRLADPTDLPYDEAHLDDEDTLTAAVDELLTRKPHLASRKPSGDVGQGAASGSGDVDLAGMLRGLAG